MENSLKAIRILILITLGSLFCEATIDNAEAYSQKLPNVVFILADDIGYGDLGIDSGNLPTPNLEWKKIRQWTAVPYSP